MRSQHGLIQLTSLTLIIRIFLLGQSEREEQNIEEFKVKDQ